MCATPAPTPTLKETGGGSDDVDRGGVGGGGSGGNGIDRRTAIEIGIDKKGDLVTGGGGDAEVDVVCATIEARWLWPILRVLRDFETPKWQLRFFADRCESMSIDSSHRMLVHSRWSCNSFYAYYVCTAYSHGPENRVNPTSIAVNTAAVPSSSSSSSVVTSDTVVVSATSDAAAVARDVVVLSIDIGSAPVPNLCTRMNVNVAHLSERLCSTTQAHAHVTFRVGFAGACSIRIGDGPALEWKQAPNEPEDDIYDVPHPDLSFRSFDSRLWWSFLSNLPPGDVVRARQSADTLSLESPSKEILVMHGEICGPVDVRPPPLDNGPPSAGETIVALDAQLLRSLRHLDDYNFVTGRIRVRCSTASPLHIGYDLDEASAVAAHTRPLQFLYSALPNVLATLVCEYLCVPHLGSFIDAFVAPRV